jgi:hypothetical protein
MNERDIHPENFLIAVRYQSGHCLRSWALSGKNRVSTEESIRFVRVAMFQIKLSATVSYVSNEVLRDGMLSL